MIASYPPSIIANENQHSDKFLSIVVPCYNEADNIKPFLTRLSNVLNEIGLEHEIILIDDGSRDETARIIAEEALINPVIKLISFSRNFGKEAALNAGLAHSSGNGVIQLDADLQHPPEVLFDFIEGWKNGHEIIYGERRSRAYEGFFKRVLTTGFYKVFSTISDVKIMRGLGDFLLLDRKVVDAILALPERERFTKGLYAWVGFKRLAVPFDVEERLHGQSGWNFFKLYKFATDAFISFGSIPLKVWTYIGLLMALSSFAYGGMVILQRLLFGNDVPGYPSLMAAICFFSGVQLLGLGIVGEYLSRVLTEVKQRPLYLVSETIGFDKNNKTSEKDTDGKQRLAS